MPILAATMRKNLRFPFTVKALTLLFLGISTGAFAQEAVTFSYTGAVQTYTVPPCVSQIQVTLKGGAGGGANGGNGATVTATLDVMSGDVWTKRTQTVHYNVIAASRNAHSTYCSFLCNNYTACSLSGQNMGLRSWSADSPDY